MYHSAFSRAAFAASQAGKRASSASKSAGVKPQRFIETRASPGKSRTVAAGSSSCAPVGDGTSFTCSTTLARRPAASSAQTPRATLPFAESVRSRR